MENPSNYVKVGNIKTHYLKAGVGDSVVVLLHGGGLDNARLSWELIIPELAKNHLVIAPDLPAYGQTDKPDVIYDLEYC